MSSLGIDPLRCSYHGRRSPLFLAEGGTMMHTTLPTSIPLRGDATPLPFHERSRMRAAALHARRLYPGWVGELLYRELCAYADFGYRFSKDALIPRLATEILAKVVADAA
jgi:hypothetical protein